MINQNSERIILSETDPVTHEVVPYTENGTLRKQIHLRTDKKDEEIQRYFSDTKTMQIIRN